MFGPYLATLDALNRTDDKQTPSRLLDLYLNMQRRAERGQFDDAVARAYRMLEWTAQWLLQRDAKIETKAVPADRIPDGVSLPQNEKGHYFAGLRNAWTLLETLGNSDDVRTFARNRGKEALVLLTIRNDSILAHGFQPITRAEWQKWDDWLSVSYYPLLQKEIKRSKARSNASQLPRNVPDNLV